MESKLCRICLNKSGTISLFDKQDDVEYCKKIMRCVNIAIEEGDGLPDSICAACATDLSTSYEFVNKCEASDKALRCTTTTKLFEDVISKCEVEIPILPIKQEDIKREYTDSFQDDDHFEDFLLDSIDNTCNDFDTKKRKRKYVKSGKYCEGGIDRRSIRSKMGPFKCSVCGIMAASRSAMNGHMRTHTGEKPFACQECDATFRLKGTMKRHILTHHTERERKYVCETCGNSFLSKNCIITHMRIHTDEKPYICPHCSRGFRQIASLIRHKRSHTNDRPYPCPVCKKKFKDSSHMKRHMVVHSDERKFICHLCNKALKTRNALKSHLAIHSNERRNICNFCGMTFTYKGNLQVHIKRKHSERSGECTVCNKIFPDLAVHMNKHTGEKPFACKMCEQAFATKRSLTNHVSFKHANASKFKCSIGDCVKTFPTAMMLEFHLLKYHTNHTPYICHHCSRGFFRTSDLSRHLRMSHMDTGTHKVQPSSTT